VIVVLDACVLYPPSLRDLLLTLAALDAFDVRWSDEILDEVTRNVLADLPDIEEARFVEQTIGAMRRAFPEAPADAPAELVEKLDNDPKDRHVAATALAARADAIVTLNVTDFESQVLGNAGVEVLTPGALVGRLLDDSLRSRPGGQAYRRPLDESPEDGRRCHRATGGSPHDGCTDGHPARTARRLTGLEHDHSAWPPAGLSPLHRRPLRRASRDFRGIAGPSLRPEFCP
jgi:predicted nucleic acid-binding protein